jgi:hypothetical protein
MRLVYAPQAALVLGVVFGYRAALPAGLQQRIIASGLAPVDGMCHRPSSD